MFLLNKLHCLRISGSVEKAQLKGEHMTQTTSFGSTHLSTKQQISSLRDTGSAHLQDQVRKRAYELYEKRGRRNGHHEQDWLQAEEEVLAQYGLKNAA
jgi:Protein of unknown function (DUF2934)